ncbi:MAG: anti-sigma factor [Bryobacteraceae bacterium]|nr:anti-sigma factor [Bryobacteraceae bacterium]
MTCDEIRELLEMYALGVLEKDEHIEIAGHLATRCPVCDSNLRKAIGLNSAVLLSAEDRQAPAALRNRVIGMVQAHPAQRSRPWGWAGVSLALAAGLALAVWNVRQKDADITALRTEVTDSTREAQRLNTAFNFLRDPQTRPASATPDAAQPRGTYFISPKGVMLVAANLAPLRPNQTYQMWVIPRGQAPRSAGLFRPDTAGGAVHFVTQEVDVPAAQALAISVEPESGSPAPTTTPLLVTPVAGL